MILNVKEAPYHALGDGSADDRAAIQRAIQDAGVAGGGTVYLPRGTYRLEAGLRVEHDGVLLAGEGRESILLHPAVDAPFIPVLFQKGSGIGADPGELRNVGAYDLVIEFAHRGPANAPAVQINHCTVWACERLIVRGDRAGMGGSATNGIAAGFGSRDGVISGCVVDGVSKPGFYIAWGERITIVGCVAQHIRGGAVPGSGVGFAAGQARDVTFIDCHAYRCEGNGFHITSMGGYPFVVRSADPTRTQLTLESAPGSGAAPGATPGALAPMIMEAIGIFDPEQARYVALPVQTVARIEGGDQPQRWHVTLDEPAPVPLVEGTTVVQAGFRPYRGVSIIGGSSCENGTGATLAAGVGIGALLVGAVGKDLLISGLTCAGNALGPGIQASSVEDLLITGCTLHNNQSGILIEDVAPFAGAAAVADLTGPARITGCEIRDNQYYGVMLRGPRDVTIESTTISITGIQVAQTGIHFRRLLDGAGARRSRNITLRNIDFRNLAQSTILYHMNQEIWPSYGSEHAAEIGDYSIAYAGAPDGVIYAPFGSEYTDTATGARYLKETAGSSRSGWVQAQIQTADASSIEPLRARAYCGARRGAASSMPWLMRR
jgi:Pectate lyase superfamily protein